MLSNDVSVFWWRGVPNFGDLLNVPLLQQFVGIEPAWSEPEQADIVAVGSVLEMLPDGWSGTILGAGKKRSTPTRDLSRARILAVRGPLSAAQVKGDVSRAVMGDPGLLAPLLLTEPVPRKYRCGVMPHWSDQLLGTNHRRGQTLIKSSTTDPLEVVRQIAECDSLVTSSLHGLIVADALGIPVQVEMAARVIAEGGTFKFDDYSESIGVPLTIGKMRTAPRESVERVQTQLREMFYGFREDSTHHGY